MSEERALAPPAHRKRIFDAETPYFFRRREDSVSWRRDSAEERFVMDVERERRRRVVEVSISSRSVSVSCCG